MVNSLLQAMSGGMGGLSRMLMGMVPGAAVFAGVFKVGREMAELNKLGAQVALTRRSFERLLGMDAEAMLGPLRAASRGAISDFDLLATATRASMLGVADSVGEMTKLMEVARIRGQMMGLSTTQAFNDLVTGIGRASPMILDNLGIITGGQKVYDDYAKSLGKSADALTNVERKQALLTKVFRETEPLLEAQDDAAVSAAEGIDSMAAAYDNLRTAMGEFIAISGETTSGMAKTVNTVAEFVRQQADLDDQTASTRARLEEMYKTGQISEEQYERLRGKLSQLSFEYGMFLISNERAAGGIEGVHNEMDQLLPLLPIQEARLRALNDETDAGVKIADAYAEAIRGVHRAIAEQARAPAARRLHWGGAPTGIVTAAAQEQAKAAEDARKEYEWTIASDYERVGILEDQLRLVKQGGEEYWNIKAQIAGINSRLQTTSTTVRDISHDLERMVDQVFQPTTVTGRDWLETNLGLYEDKPDEYLRRLRSAAQDADSEWKALLGGRTGGEAELFVAQQEEAWRTGQWEQMGPGFDPEQSKDAMINMVIANIEAERARQAMIADIMRDPRLAGMGLSEAEITAMTGQPVAATGAEQARTLVTGARQVDIGGQLTETIDEQFRAQSDTYIALGGVMITWISTGMEAASPDVVGSLAKLLFPHLVDLQTQAGNRP